MNVFDHSWWNYDKVVQDGNGGGGWRADHGQMISAPASSREEALTISNELMKHFDGVTLKIKEGEHE